MTNAQQSDEVQLQWWILSQNSEFSAQRLIFIKIMDFHYKDKFSPVNEFSSQWCTFIACFNLDTNININHNDANDK